MNTNFKKIILVCLSLVMLLSGCTTELKSKETDYTGEISLSDIELFYESNKEILNKSAYEYLFLNPNRNYINIFCNEYNQFKIWDATNKVDLTSEKKNYIHCIEIISAMNDCMLAHSFEKPQLDYSVRISYYGFGSQQIESNKNCCAVMYEFTAYDINVEKQFYFSSFSVAEIDNTMYYRLYYSETELSEFEKISDNWYVDVWHHI